MRYRLLVLHLLVLRVHVEGVKVCREEPAGVVVHNCVIRLVDRERNLLQLLSVSLALKANFLVTLQDSFGTYAFYLPLHILARVFLMRSRDFVVARLQEGKNEVTFTLLPFLP